MSSSHNLPDFLNKNVKLVAYCPLCNKKFNPLEAQIVDEREEAYLVYLRCRQCYSSIVALMMSNPLGVTSVGLVTDLNNADLVKLKDGESVSDDDVLAMHLLTEKSDLSVHEIINSSV